MHTRGRGGGELPLRDVIARGFTAEIQRHGPKSTSDKKTELYCLRRDPKCRVVFFETTLCVDKRTTYNIAYARDGGSRERWRRASCGLLLCVCEARARDS